MTAASLGLLALMASGPFLLPFHLPPIPSFWSEWWAGVLGLAAVATGVAGVRASKVGLPAVVAMPTVLCTMILLQLAAGRLDFPQFGLLYAAYLLWAAMLMILGHSLVKSVGFVRLADVMAAAFLVGALAAAPVAIAQWLGFSEGSEWLFPKFGSNVYSNLGQANHYAHYSWLGVASAIYLRERGVLGRWMLWLVLLLTIFGSVLTGSRGVFVFALVIFAASAWKDVRAGAGFSGTLATGAALLLPAALVLSLAGSLLSPLVIGIGAASGLPAAESAGSVMSGARLFDAVSGQSARLELARGAWWIFLQRPWLGVGVGNFGWASFLAASTADHGSPVMVGEHAHNLVLHLLAEFGVLATGAVVLVVVLWAGRFLRQRWGPEHAWCAAVLGIGAVHACLEYPLWYAYFLGPAALLLGATAGGARLEFPRWRAMVYLCLFVAGGAAILAGLRQDYSTIETAVFRPLAAHQEREQAWRITMERLLRMQRESLLSPWALLVFTNLTEPSRELVDQRIVICQRGIRLTPARSLVTKCAMQLALGGRGDEALELARQALRAFPQQEVVTREEFARHARDYPEVRPLAALGAVAAGK
jgi:O-antigen ligase